MPSMQTSSRIEIARKPALFHSAQWELTKQETFKKEMQC